jgi:hypothetical protein
MFEITGDDIAALTDADLRTLVARLAIAELDRQGLPISGVTAGGNQDAADGGLDVRVEVPDLPAPDFVPRSTTGYQVKKPNMTASAIADEMRPHGTLRPVIGGLADAGGAYIVFSAQGSVADGPLGARRQAMRDAVADHPNGSALLVDFYDRERMAIWANQYTGVAAWVRARLGRGLSGWRPIGGWSEGSVANGSPYLQNDQACLIDERSKDREKLPIGEGIARLREALSRPRQAVRLIGLSGLGKTRLVQALFETGVGDQPLDPAIAVYTDYSEQQTTPTAREMAHRLVDTDQRAILIVDNCNPQTHADLANICAGTAGRVSLLTVEYDVKDDEPERTDVFRLENASPALVEKWLQQNFDNVSQVDRGRIAEFSDGNFRVARALAGTLRRGETLGRLRDRQLFERIFQQRNDPDQALLLAAEDLSLLYSFDGEDTSDEAELTRIGAIRGVTAAQLYAHVDELKRRGVVQSRGRWRAILPHAIANPLATYALQRIPPADFDRFCSQLRARMLKSVSRRLGYLHDDAAAGAAVARWLRPDGPLGDVLLLGELGMDILRNVAPVSPEVVLAKIEAEITGSNGARILSTENRQRGHWISLIKALGYDAAMFEDAAFALARFVAAEPEGHNYNSADRHFGELFQLHLSGTQATPDARREVIRRMAASNDAAIRAGAMQALDSMLEASHFTSLSRHDFGARPRDYGWRPQTFGEIWNWFDEGVALAVELSSTLPAARKVLADNIRGIWRHHRCQDALDAASVELTREGPWIEGWIGFRQSLAYDAEGMPEEMKARLVGIVERLKPTDLLNRARAIVIARSGSGFDILEGMAASPSAAWRIADQQAVDLGKAFANEPEQLATFLPEVYGERNPHRAFQFGVGLAEGAVDLQGQWDTLLAAFKGMPADGRNATVLGGYIRGASANPAFVATALDGVADDAEMARDLAYLQARAGVDRDGIARLSAAFDAGKIEAGALRQLASGVVGKAPGDALAKLLTKLAAHPGGSGIAIDILHMNFHCAADEKREYDADLVACGRHILSTANFDNQHSLGDYGVGEVVQVCLAGPDGEVTARAVCRRVREGLDSYAMSAYQIGYLLKALFAVQPAIALDTFLLGDETDIEIRLERRSPLNEMDVAVLREWADIDPETRYPLVGRLLSMFETNGLDDVVGLSSRFVDLLEHAPNRAAFLGDGSRLYPSGWAGSLADVLEKRRAMLEPLASHHDPAVTGWLERLDGWLGERIASERRRDAEREESFE